MTKNHYRILVVVSLILLILSVKIDVIFNLLPDQYQIRLPNPLDGEMIILLGFMSLGVIASFYGCIRFLSWAPMLNLITTACFLVYILGNNLLSVKSSCAQVLEFLASATFGVVLMLPYINENVKGMFWPKSD
ncbi:hypothetical protein ACFIQG_21740 [Comamonas odontotermitis]|uniref:hypothetical protein n=1 Tax=Comamonas odontotermitis TaxID=379895 RepID=UPI00366F848C